MRGTRASAPSASTSSTAASCSLGEEKYALIDVLPHDDAIAFAVSRRFTVNQTLGVLEMRDQAGIEEFARTEPVSPHSGLFDHVSAAEFVRLGVDEDLLPLLRVITTDQQLESLAGRLPETQLDVLRGLASGMTVQEVWEEMAPRIVTGVDTDDLLTAARRTPERITFVSGPVELAAILAHPFDLWRTFLHPTQRDVAYRETYSGPAHRMKGLEFRCLAVVGLDAGVLPAANALTPAVEDPHAHRQDLQRERCLLFVALTRARDVLYLSHAGTPSPLLPVDR